MRILSSNGEQALDQIAQRHGFGVDATRTMLDAVANGHGTMAQFAHAEFGGAGQWMRGGMTMVSDLFNHQLKDRVNGLCADLSNLIGNEPDLFRRNDAGSSAQGGGATPMSTSSGAWWPGEFGSPNASGSQNGTRYAYFAVPRRLAIERNGQVQVHDTLDHRIGGISQQQPGGDGSLSFTSQHGPVDLTRLPLIDGGAVAPSGAPTQRTDDAPSAIPQAHDAVYASIEKLAALHAKGILSNDEFSTKKAELLARL